MSRVLRYVLAAFLGLFVWMTLAGWSLGSVPERVSAGIFAGFMILVLIAVLFPARAMIPLRTVAAVVAISFIAYFVTELVQLVRGEEQHLAIGEPSAFMAGLGLVLFGIPAAVFALSGEPVGWLGRILRRKDRRTDRPV